MRVSEGGRAREARAGLCRRAAVFTLLCSPGPGVFICRGKEDALVTKNLVPGESVYGEKRVSISVRPGRLAKPPGPPANSVTGDLVSLLHRASHP